MYSYQCILLDSGSLQNFVIGPDVRISFDIQNFERSNFTEQDTSISRSLETMKKSNITEIHFDPLVMHTISLLWYNRKINCYRVRMGPPPSIPVFNPLKLSLLNMQDMANEFSEENMQLLLRKAVAVLAAHLGFVSRN
ncbi:ATP synthase subunit beta [Dirofilaria immitis]